jgi:hypothetical protein
VEGGNIAECLLRVKPAKIRSGKVVVGGRWAVVSVFEGEEESTVLRCQFNHIVAMNTAIEHSPIQRRAFATNT